MRVRKPRRTPRIESERNRGVATPPVARPAIPWPMLHISSPEFQAAYNAYFDSIRGQHQQPVNAMVWYGVMLARIFA